MIVIGLLLSYIVVFIFELVLNSWWLMFGSVGIFVIVLCIGMIKFSELFCYLIKNGMSDKVCEVLCMFCWLIVEVEVEVFEIESVVVYE